MATDLHDILPGVTAGGTKISHQYFVYFPGRIVDLPEDHPARNEFFRRDCAGENLARERTRRRDRTTE